MRRLVVVVALVVGLSALFVFGLRRGQPDRDVRSVLLGKPVADFTMPLYERYRAEYGSSLRLADYQGRPRVINFWASWCPPCRDEAPLLEAAWREHADEVLFLGVQSQESGERARLKGREFLDDFALTFPNGFDDDSAIAVDYGLFGMPETFFVAADGTLIHKHVGPVTPALLAEKIAELKR